MSRRVVPQRRFALPADATEIVLVRHGASAHAVEGVPFPVTGGHADPPLAPEGAEQAARVAERLAREEIASLFVTTLRRTHETAAPLAAALALEPVVVPELREVHLGEWEGVEWRLRITSGDPLAMRVVTEENWALIPGAEAPEHFAERVRAGIRAVVARTGPGARAVAVAHGGVIAEACRQAAASRPFAFLHVENCSITRLVVLGDDRWLIRGFNDVTHLDG